MSHLDLLFLTMSFLQNKNFNQLESLIKKFHSYLKLKNVMKNNLRLLRKKTKTANNLILRTERL